MMNSENFQICTVFEKYFFKYIFKHNYYEKKIGTWIVFSSTFTKPHLAIFGVLIIKKKKKKTEIPVHQFLISFLSKKKMGYKKVRV